MLFLSGPFTTIFITGRETGSFDQIFRFTTPGPCVQYFFQYRNIPGAIFFAVPVDRRSHGFPRQPCRIFCKWLGLYVIER